MPPLFTGEGDRRRAVEGVSKRRCSHLPIRSVLNNRHRRLAPLCRKPVYAPLRVQFPGGERLHRPNRQVRTLLDMRHWRIATEPAGETTFCHFQPFRHSFAVPPPLQVGEAFALNLMTLLQVGEACTLDLMTLGFAPAFFCLTFPHVGGTIRDGRKAGKRPRPGKGELFWDFH